MRKVLRVISNLFVVFMLCTLSTQIMSMYRVFLYLRHGKSFVKILNSVIKIWKNLQGDNNLFRGIFVNRKIYCIQLLLIFFVVSLLATEDFIRGHQLTDMLSYSLTEILVLISILEKVNVILMFKKVFGVLRQRIKGSKMDSVEDIYDKYYALHKLLEKYSKLNSGFFFYVIVNCFIWSMYNIYKFIILIFFEFTKFPTRNFSMSILLSFTWIFLHFFHLAILIWAYNKVNVEKKNFIYDLSLKFCSLGVETRRRYSDLIVSISTDLLMYTHEKNAVIFDLGPPLMLRIFGSCVTYILVLVSFE
ncbi:uncharacterized protein LOC114329392 [Diabrotica virgifera virgifera]|uniref:Gustatory receptor n=1 Tax=Diabrotica virgifera virgifera TaxID=50390 RepID=A0ABM5IJJ4_DIAVI|nr:uncharacterized protein LOC114329392 [Diabrotica virgifera virgifera]